MFCYISLESVVPKGHPLRAIEKMVDITLKELSPKFDAMYSNSGRPNFDTCEVARFAISAS